MSILCFLFFLIILKSRKENVLLPEAGSGGFSRLPSLGISPQVLSIASQNQEGTGPSNLGSSYDLEEGTPCLSFLFSAQAAGQLCRVCLLPLEPIPGYPAQSLLATVHPALYSPGVTTSPESAPWPDWFLQPPCCPAGWHLARSLVRKKYFIMHTNK